VLLCEWVVCCERVCVLCVSVSVLVFVWVTESGWVNSGQHKVVK
jgi:hypothetical protein